MIITFTILYIVSGLFSAEFSKLTDFHYITFARYNIKVSRRPNIRILKEK
jgi:hypothetical protein